MLIDAANDDQRLLKLISDGGGHHRHHPPASRPLAGAAAVAARTGARLVCGRPDLDAIAERQPGSRGLVRVWDGDTVELGAETLEVIGLVGHTPGSIALAYAAGGCPICSPATACFRVGRAKPAVPEDFTSLMDDLEPRSSPGSTTTPSCTPATATTPPWARSARTWRSGARGAGRHARFDPARQNRGMRRRIGPGLLIIAAGPRRLHGEPVGTPLPTPASYHPTAGHLAAPRPLPPSPSASTTPSRRRHRPAAKPRPKPHPISVQALIEKKYDGRDLRLGRQIGSTNAYKRYLISYRGDGRGCPA